MAADNGGLPEESRLQPMETIPTPTVINENNEVEFIAADMAGFVPRIKISARQRWRTLATTMVVDLMGCYAPRRSDNQLAI
ncbi:hypothetical protein OsJ_30474 [Oryza sativa Japonica Group]|uniref:Uncharacterized protein n=3 Tax=Oryza TaxID=4527 RepID=A0A979HL18_ORYSJ|nr:Unknown protein [Oryza sativa Japonica Group]AAP51792.1 hypothetical protein LOC_Os10g01670 [Oryza sativa Japonica Group]EAZ15064.1 hypothetical protein OsJ_30474 [Oryza sativa Japonica Group]